MSSNKKTSVKKGPPVKEYTLNTPVQVSDKKGGFKIVPKGGKLSLTSEGARDYLTKGRITQAEYLKNNNK